MNMQTAEFERLYEIACAADDAFERALKNSSAQVLDAGPCQPAASIWKQSLHKMPNTMPTINCASISEIQKGINSLFIIHSSLLPTI